MKMLFNMVLLFLLIMSNSFADNNLKIFERLNILEGKIVILESCQKQYNSRTKSSESLNKYMLCIDNKIQDLILMDDKKTKTMDVLQIFLTDSKKKAENMVIKYNIDIQRTILRKTKAKFIERYISDAKIIKDGRYYKVVIYQNEINMNMLKKNIHKVFKKNYQDAFITKIFVGEFEK